MTDTPIVERRSRVPVRILIAVILIALLIALAIVLWVRGRPSPGPLARPGTAVTGFDEAKVNQTMTWGLTDVIGQGEVLDSIELVDATEGLRIVGAYATPRTGPVYGASNKALPKDQTYIALPYQMKGRTFLSLTIRVSAPGRYMAKAFRLVYHIGNKHYEAVFPIGVTVTATA
jgi:hypothetical protein